MHTRSTSITLLVGASRCIWSHSTVYSVLIIDAFSYSYFKYLVAKLMRSKLHTIVNV